MSTSDALAAFVGFEVKLPNGTVVRGQPLPYKKALEYMERLARFREKPTDDLLLKELGGMVSEFPGIVQLTPAEALEPLTFGEVMNVIRCFFTPLRAETQLLPPPDPAPPATPPT